MRYEIRARDKHGDFGVCMDRLWWRWRAERALAKEQAKLEAMRKKMNWTGQWEFYIREVP